MAKGVEPGFEALALIAAVVFVESPGFCVVVQVHPFLPGVHCCVGLAGLVVGVGVARGEGLHVSEGDLSSQGGLVEWPAIDFEIGDYVLVCSRVFLCGGGDAREDCC